MSTMFTYSRKEIDNLLVTLGFDVKHEGPTNVFFHEGVSCENDFNFEDAFEYSRNIQDPNTEMTLTVFYGDIVDSYNDNQKVLHVKNDDIVVIMPWDVDGSNIVDVLKEAGCGTIEVEWFFEEVASE